MRRLWVTRAKAEDVDVGDVDALVEDVDRGEDRYPAGPEVEEPLLAFALGHAGVEGLPHAPTRESRAAASAMRSACSMVWQNTMRARAERAVPSVASSSTIGLVALR